MRDAKGKFTKGNPGRPMGSRNKLEESYLTALHKDFEANGSVAIEECRKADPTGYLRVISSVMPKHSEKTIKHDVQRLSDDELFSYLKELRDNIGAAPSLGGDGTQAKDKARLN